MEKKSFPKSTSVFVGRRSTLRLILGELHIPVEKYVGSL
jgi:hypothetical protein